jgi:dolichyl-phosphate-mannose-protein mannosyltransferase
VNFEFKITQIDLVTIVLLSILFFSIAAYNLGEVNYAQTNWVNTSNAAFYLDLGSRSTVQTVYFFVRQGNATVQVSSGTPDNWNYIGQFNLESDDRDYHKFFNLPLNIDTQYLEFNVTSTEYDSRPQFYWVISNPTDQTPSPYISVTEIGLIDQENQQIVIQNITAINGTDSTITRLVDEQGSIELPPTYMSKMYFDEIYFSRAAIEFANHHVPVERTHPPLGKLIQSIGIMAFGETPFGWRIMGVLFGALMIPLMFLIAKKLFGTWIAGFSASFLFSFDFMHFTMARIGTVDTYVVFFSLMTQLFFLIYFGRVLKDGWKTSVVPLFLAVVFAALGFATKWFSLFGVIGMLALLLMLRLREVKNLKGTLSDKYVAVFNHPFLLLLAFVGVFAAIYFATYIPEMLIGDSPLTIFNLQNSMLSFHGGTVTDVWSAPWWTWPFMFNPSGTTVPKWFDITDLPNNVSTITAFGNPAVWWVGFGAMVLLALKAFRVEELFRKLLTKSSTAPVEGAPKISERWDAAAIFIVVVFLFSWLAYVFIGRSTYIYHYYLSVPLLCLAITYFINKIWSKSWGKIVAIAIFAVTVAMFLLFYTVISGFPVTSDYVHYLKWFPSWYFAP